MLDDEPKAGEVWETRAGRLALIVHGPVKVYIASPTDVCPSLHPTLRPLMMLWKDHTGEWTVSEILDRLSKKHSCTQEVFFLRASSW